MTFRKALVSLVALWALGVVHSTVRAQAAGAAQAAPKSVWDGAYTEEQAKRGEAAYTQNCSECHQQELTGDGFAPALTGTDFMSAWNGLSVGDLYDRVRTSMPPGKEGSVPNQTKADIVAHILHFNKFPAGQSKLGTQVDVLKGIKFEANKPGGN